MTALIEGVAVRIAALAAFCLCASAAVLPTSVVPQGKERPGAGAGTISGVVTDGHTGHPVAGALVQLTVIAPRLGSAASSRPRQMTDGGGRFIFQTLAAGSYSLQVVAPGYLVGRYGSPPNSKAVGRISIEERQWFADANVALWKPASISGTIRDEAGEPVVDVPVRIIVAFSLAGRGEWASGAVVQTDDRGAYRFDGLSPGHYVIQVPSIQVTLPDGEVALYNTGTAEPLPAIRTAGGLGRVVGYFAVPPESSSHVYPATFYPSARSLNSASVIAVDFGDEQRATDISLVPSPSVSVSGTVIGPTSAVARVPVRLVAAGNESLGFGAETALTVADNAGRFTLVQVPPGDYSLVVGRALNEFVVRSPDGALPSLVPNLGRVFLGNISGSRVGSESGISVSSTAMNGEDVTGRLAINVGTQTIDGLIVPVTSGVTISGRALYDGADAPAEGRSAGRFGPMIRLDPADSDLTRSMRFSTPRPDPTDSRFSIANVVPGRYRIIDQGNRDFRLVGATWNGQDLFATPLEVTGDRPVSGIVVYLSSKHNSVAGMVYSADRQKPAAATVIVFPEDRNRWGEPGIAAALFRILEVSVDGAFSMLDLIPGDYFIAAAPSGERVRGLDTEFLRLLAPQAVRITVGESTTLTVDLRVTGARR